MHLYSKSRINVRWTIKYPFTEEAREYIRRSAPSLEEFEEEEIKLISDYALARIKDLLYNKKRDKWTEELESVSYPIEVAIIKATRNSSIQRLFAERESKRLYAILLKEEDENIIHLAKSTFNLRLTYSNINDEFILHFIDYIKIAIRFTDNKWKLVNRFLKKGFVYLDKKNTCRIIAEKLRDYILNKIRDQDRTIPKIINSFSEKLVEYHKEWAQKRKHASIQIQGKKLKRTYFPPCVRETYNMALNGSNISHMARFLLVTFLLEMGYTIDEVIKVISNTPDFNAQKTKYQVEHIAGLKGGRKRYKIPSCKSLKTYSLCRFNRKCKGIKNPKSYIWKKQGKKTI
jgi:DNA primase large subunit